MTKNSRTRVENQRPANLVKFTLGNIPLDEFDQATIRLLRAVADGEGATMEEIFSDALDWVIAHRDSDPNAQRNIIKFPADQKT